MDRRIVTLPKDGQTITIHPNYREQPSSGAGSKFIVFLLRKHSCLLLLTLRYTLNMWDCLMKTSRTR